MICFYLSYTVVPFKGRLNYGSILSRPAGGMEYCCEEGKNTMPAPLRNPLLNPKYGTAAASSGALHFQLNHTSEHNAILPCGKLAIVWFIVTASLILDWKNCLDLKKRGDNYADAQDIRRVRVREEIGNSIDTTPSSMNNVPDLIF